MKARKFALVALIIPIILLGIGDGLNAQSLDLSKSVANITTASVGTIAKQGDILEYTIVVRNIASVTLTDARLYDNVPAGVAYVVGSTLLNGITVPDVGGVMPFTSTGAPINAPSQVSGNLSTGTTATVKFRVRVTANGGNITNYAIAEAKNGVNTITQNTNSVFTNLTADAACNTVYMSTSNVPNGTSDNRRWFRTVSTTNGKMVTTIYNGETGQCFNAFTGANLGTGANAKAVAAIAFHKDSNRIYFVNNYDDPRQDLCYVDMNVSPVVSRRYVGYPIATSTANGMNINRMCFASDGYGYAISSNGQAIVRFIIKPGNIPEITPLGPLLNDISNGSSNNILNETGGDIFGDGSGNLYLVANSSKLYKINPNTRVSTYLGQVNQPASSSNSIAVDASGNVYISGAYQNVYRVDLTSMVGTSITSGSTTNVYTNGDYTSCGFPVLAPALIANKTYRNINGSPFTIGGDTVEYRIEVTNTGNINAAGVKLHDDIPTSTLYIPNSTRLNGIAVPDVAGVMPFAVTGGRYINSPVETQGIIKPTVPHMAVMTFRVKIPPLALVCNQSRITLFDVNGQVIFINSNDPTLPGGQNPTCFFSDGTLPIGNLAFKGSLLNDKSLLQWEVKDEQHINYYEIQYSTDGANFTPTGQVISKGNNNDKNTYQFTDQSHTEATLRFYRLRIVGTRGGAHSYSPVIRLSLKNLQNIRVQPNPFDKVITAKIQLRNSDKVLLRLIDVAGQEIIRSDERLSRGDHTLTLTVGARLTPGVYVLELVTTSDNAVYRQKLIKR